MSGGLGLNVGHCSLVSLPFTIYIVQYSTSYNPKLDTRISFVLRPPPPSVTLRVPPLDSETGWTGELWSNPATTTTTPMSRSGYPPWILQGGGLESSG